MSIKLENSKILLRAMEPEDIKTLYEWENDSKIWHVSNTITPFSKYILKQYIENAQADIYETKQLRLIIELKEDSTPIGMIDLFDFDPYNLRAGIGISINNENERQKGYAGQALQVFTKYAFEHLGLIQLYCDITEDNEASLRLFKSQGFEIEGFKNKWLKIGKIHKGVYFLQKLA